MAHKYIGTPNATHVSINSDGFGDIDDLVPEASFVVPKDRDVLLKGGRNGLRTPAAGGALQLLPNGNQVRGKAEFTPLLKSVAKTNISKRLSASARRRGASNTPGNNTPGLPRYDDSNIATEHTSSSVGRNDYTPMPQNVSSSVASTPLAQLPTRDGAVVNDGNVMTLREQENIIDKIEKENFGLKMKIHFLEENLSKRGGEFNQAALKENTDLKVNRITMQRELHKFKKTIVQAERDAELYKRQLEEYRERVRQKKADETFRIEMANLKSELEQKDQELDQLRAKYDKVRSSNDSETEKLRDEVADLQADLRERDRQLDEREDEIDALKSNTNKDANAAAELDQELEDARQEIEHLRNDLEKANAAAKEAKEERESAEEEQRRAEEALHDLEDDVANKSIVPQGLSKRLEERAAKFEHDYHDLKERFQELQSSLEEKSQSERQLQERLRHAEKEGSSDLRHMQQELENAQQKSETFERKYNNMAKQVEAVNKELLIKTDEKDLLQTRHDALTTESAQLQNDLAKTRKSISSLESAVDQEKQRAAQNDNQLRLQHRNELNHLTDQIDTLHREASTRDEQHATEVEGWAAERRTMEAAKSKAEEKASGLQRTVDKLNDAQGTLSGREMRLQEALESEKQRHQQEEKVLSRQIEELNQDLAAKRTASEDNRSELNNAREELRISVREQALLKEKITELEDEIEVLQADIEQEHDLVQQLQQKSSLSSDAQFARLKKEKADVQESLASLRLELDAAKRASQAAEAERDDLEAQLEKAQQNRAHDDTFNLQQEKRELKRERQRLESDLEKVRTERDTLVQTNRELEEELDAEIERATAEEHKLNTELDSLRNKQLVSSDGRDKEILSAKNKIHRLETRIRDLEDLLENQSRKVSSPSVDISGLRHDLGEARKNETAATKRETELKSSNRDLKMKLNDLERQLHEARLAELKAKSPTSSVSSNSGREINELRQEVFDARAQLKSLREENQQLRRNSRKSSQDETQQAVLQAQLESKVDEIDELVGKLESQNELVETLRKDLVRIREERNEARQATRNTTRRDDSLDLRTELKRLRGERDEARNVTLQIAGRSKDALRMKSELLRLREERMQANQRAETVEKELDVVQSRYESMLERLTAGPQEDNGLLEKQIRGLMKEVLWLKAKCRREERMRKDLAWSKTYLENSDAMRMQCNQVDLRILREMGIDIDRKKYEQKLAPIQKFRAGVFCVMAAIRMSNLEEQWRDARKIGDELRHARKRQTRQMSCRTMEEV
ncbi:hypothetical protein OHC33_006127 [Knufia fluminis]|uniref:Uncharacterized protein n=1 Tax=Knufia fluminis TaxID=191047 RepID=A0AAN8EFM6_9EURO|nr:hypothetical protein OHC33_006127 [Knufia fluminis]